MVALIKVQINSSSAAYILSGELFISIFVPQNSDINTVHIEYILKVFFCTIRDYLVNITNRFELCVPLNDCLYGCVLLWS